jgi:hypothetical protein
MDVEVGGLIEDRDLPGGNFLQELKKTLGVQVQMARGIGFVREISQHRSKKGVPLVERRDGVIPQLVQSALATLKFR